MLFTQRWSWRYLIGTWGLLVFGSRLQAREITLQMPRPTAQAKRILVTNPDLNHLYLVELNQTPQFVVIDSACAAQQVNWSADQRYLAFKRFEYRPDGEILQAPVVYAINSGRIEVLHAPVVQAGVPTFTHAGKIAYTIGEKLYLLDSRRKIQHTYRLGNYANLAPISPDGDWVIFNDRHDQFWMLNLAAGTKFKLTADRQGYVEPQWSPDSRKIAARTLSGQLVIWDLARQTEIELEPGDAPSWSPDGNWLFYRQVSWNQRLEIVGADIIAVRSDGSQRLVLTPTPDVLEADPQLSVDGLELWYTAPQIAQWYRAEIAWQTGMPQIVRVESQPLPHLELRDVIPNARPEMQVLRPTSVYFEAPYLHQVYDTPDGFNGHWACGATSAMMGLAYYEILSPWPCTCSTPRVHTSDFGRYISETYTFNGYTYNIAGADASGRSATGGYGFIIQNDWAETRGYMAQYLRQHGLGSEVDWAPTQAKARKEVDQRFPFVLLNSLTSSGHYILTVGYDSARNALIVNDPYGNKNYGYMNYSGKQAIYDWPGYYSGHSNLNTVHCFIYMRQAADLTAANIVAPDTAALGDTLEVRATLHNQGIRHANAFGYGWYWMNYYPAIPTTTPQWQADISQLNAGDSTVVYGKVVVPDSTPSRRYGIGIKVDHTNLLTEMSEANNYAYTLTVVRGYPMLAVGYPVASSLIRTGQPRIFAWVGDEVVGIDTTSLHFWLDDRALTAASQFHANVIAYTPAAPLANGEHFVRARVTNRLGYTTNLAWKFKIQASVSLTENDRTPQIISNGLELNYPNPFNLQTTIPYQIARSAPVLIQIFDVTGRQIRILLNTFQNPGTYRVSWDGADERGQTVASGIYFCRLQAGDFSAVRSLVLIK